MERAPGTHWLVSWVGLRAGLDAVVKRKIPSPYRDSNLDDPAMRFINFIADISK
jgi:hypothetical protein